VVDLKIYEIIEVNYCISVLVPQMAIKAILESALLYKPYVKDVIETPTVWIKPFVCDKYSSRSYVLVNTSAMLLIVLLISYKNH
jgi:hypothetical protein